MLQLIAAGPFSFAREEDPPRWRLQEGAGGETALPLSAAPFEIGRSSDCALVLPDSEELCRTTSRWHCHLLRRC